MSNFKITRVVLAMSALVGFTGVQAISQHDLQNSSVYKNYNQNQGIDPERAATVQSWKDSITADPSINLDDHDLSYFTQNEQNELYNHQADAHPNQSYGNSTTGVDAYPITATSNFSGVDNSAIIKQWKEYIAKEIADGYKPNLSSLDGFSSTEKKELKAYEKQALAEHLYNNSSDGSDGEEDPWDDEQPSTKSNSTVSGVKTANGYINNAGQWVASTSAGQGAIKAANEVAEEIKDDMKEMAAEGTKAIFKGALNKLLRKMGLDPVAQQPVQPNVPTTPAQSGPPTIPVQYGPQPKYQPGNPATLYQPQSQSGYQPVTRHSGPPALPTTPVQYGPQPKYQPVNLDEIPSSTPPAVQNPSVSGIVTPDWSGLTGKAKRNAIITYLEEKIKENPSLDISAQPGFNELAPNFQTYFIDKVNGSM